jgi:thiamine-phosphate pyrophosphorylase
MGIGTRLRLARVMFVTDERPAAEIEDLVDAALAGGADIVEYKAPSVRERERLTVLERLRTVAQRYQALLCVAGDPGRFDADVVHLGDAGDAARVKKGLHEWAVIGRSCNSAAEIDAALADEAIDFLVVGPGLDHLRHAAAKAPQDDPASKPWFAAGGVTAGTLDIVWQAGARRVAVSRAIAAASDPEQAAHDLKERLREAWNEDPAMEKVTMAAFGTKGGPVAGGFSGGILPPSDGLRI